MLGVCALDLRFTDLVIQADFVVVDCLAIESSLVSIFMRGRAVLLTYLTSFSRSGVCQFLWCMARTLMTLSMVETLSIPPFSEIQTMVSCNPVIDHRTWLIEGSRADLPILIARALGTSTPTSQRGYMCLFLLSTLFPQMSYTRVRGWQRQAQL